MIIVERKPTTPGEILQREFLTPLNLTQKQLAEHIGCDVKVINRIINEKTSITAETALKLASTFDTTPEFWLNAQQAVDIYNVRQKMKYFPEPIHRAS